MAVDLGTGYLEVEPQMDAGFEKTVTSRFGAVTKKIGGQMQSLGRGLSVGLTLPLIGLAGAGLKEASESEQVARVVQQTLESTGNSAVISAEQVDTMAASISNLTAVDDEAVAKTGNLLLNLIDFKKFGDQADETLQAMTQGALDYSAATGKSEKAGTKLFATIANDPEAAISSLKKLGVITEEDGERLTKMAEKGDKVKVSQELMAKATERWAGSAEASATPTERLQTTMANLLEAFGSILSGTVLPALDFLADKVKAVTEWMQNLSGPWKTVAKVAIGFAIAIGPILIVVGKIIGGITKFTGVLKTLGIFVKATLWPMIQGFFAFLMAHPFILIAAAVIALGVIIFKNWDKIKAFLFKVWNALKAAGIAVWNFIKKAAFALWNAIKVPVLAYLRFWRGVWNVIKDAALKVWQWIKEAAITVWHAIRDAWNGVKAFFSGLWEGVKAAAKSAWDFVKRYVINPMIDGINLAIRGLNLINPFEDIPYIPLLARGGLVTRPTLAMIGERGPEAVIPLDRIASGIGGGGNHITGTLVLTPESRAYVEAVVDDDAGGRARHARVLRRAGSAA